MDHPDIDKLGTKHRTMTNRKEQIQHKKQKDEQHGHPSKDRVLRGYHTLQGDNSLKSVERFDHMMCVCRIQASR